MTPPRESAARAERATAPPAGTVAARALAREAAARATAYRATAYRAAPAAAPAPRPGPARAPKPRTRPASEPPKRRRVRRNGEPELAGGSAQPRRASRPARASYSAPAAPRPRPRPREEPLRRESRPRPRPQSQPRLRRAPVNAPLPLRLLAGVLHNPLLDRLTKGRLCIGVVAFALVGIVGMNLLQLPLNTDIGAALARQQTLSQQNSALRLQISSLTSTNRIEALASKLGMVPSAPGAIRFLDARQPPAASAVRAALAQPVSATGAAGQGGPADGGG